MKTKLLSLLLFVLLSSTIKSQTSTTDYVAGVVDATYLTMNGTDMYVLGSTNIYKIDTTVSNPTPTIIYTTQSDFFLVNFTTNGSLLYVVLENYIVATDTFVGGKIISLDLNNLSNPTQDIYTTGEYISSITNNGTTVYITAETPTNPPNFEPFTTHLDEIDASSPNPTAQVIVNNVTNTSVIRGSVFDNNTIYFSSSDDEQILTIDVSQSNPTVGILLNNSAFSRGIFKSNNELYISNGNSINKLDVTNPSAGLTVIAVNDTYQDTNDGNTFFANFRDVALVGNTVYATLQNQGRVVQAIDMTLSTNNIEVINDFSIYPNPTKGLIEIQSSIAVKNVSIYNSTGRLIRQFNTSRIDISNLETGLYLVEIKTIKDEIITKKLIKN